MEFSVFVPMWVFTTLMWGSLTYTLIGLVVFLLMFARKMRTPRGRANIKMVFPPDVNPFRNLQTLFIFILVWPVVLWVNRGKSNG